MCKCQPNEFFNFRTNQCEIINTQKTLTISTTLTKRETTKTTSINPQSICFRISNDGVEMYWNGSSCLNALGYGMTCHSLLECQYLTQKTTCTGTSPNYVNVQHHNISIT